MRTTITTMFYKLKKPHQTMVSNMYFKVILRRLMFIKVVLLASLSSAAAFETSKLETIQAVAYLALGDFQLDTTSVDSVSSISGHKLLASVSEKPGSNFSMFLPFGVQQINYVVNNGSYVEENQSIAYLKGFDVHHFLDEYEAAKELFTSAQQQYKSSKRLYARKALQQSQWLDISKNHFAAQLRFEHLNHYKSFLNIDRNENIAIKSPVSGYVRFSSDVAVKEEGELIFDVIAKKNIRLKVSVPVKNIINLANINVLGSQCQLGIESKDNIVKNFNQTVWSSVLSENCRFTLGEQLIVIPQYEQQAFELPKSAIFEFDNQNYAAIKNDAAAQFQLIAVEILSSAGSNYQISSEIDLTNKQALITSISALQGILLELGGE